MGCRGSAIFRLPLFLCGHAALPARWVNKDSDWAPSMMRDIDQGHGRLEADVIVGDMLARATALGLPAILTAAAYTHLQVYGARAASGG